MFIKKSSVSHTEKLRLNSALAKHVTKVRRQPNHTSYLVSTDDTIKVQCIGVGCVDSNVQEVYRNVKDMPNWLQTKIAVLRVAQDGYAMDGIGRKISETTFMVEVD